MQTKNYKSVIANLILVLGIINFSLFTGELNAERSTGPRDSIGEPLLPKSRPDIKNQGEVILGKRLFSDTRLSKNDQVSCASCHDINAGGDDGLPASVGVRGQVGKINSPSVFNSVDDLAQFWDGRSSNLHAQVREPIHNPVEMDSNWQEVVAKLKKDEELLEMFHNVYGTGPDEHTISSAIAAYQAMLITYDSPFDLYLKGSEDAISSEAKKGYSLFLRRGCISCHQGKNIGGNMYQVFGATKPYFSDDGTVDPVHFGRFNVTGLAEDKYKFKVPSLRNVAQTAPYLHDGSVQTLESVVRLMAEHQLGMPVPDSEIHSIVAFLESLTGNIRAELK